MAEAKREPAAPANNERPTVSECLDRVEQSVANLARAQTHTMLAMSERYAEMAVQFFGKLK